MSAAKKVKTVGRPPLVANRREMILETAARLFGQLGFESCSMQDISESAAVTKGNLYHYFRTKQEIYDAIFLKTLRQMTQYVDHSIDQDLDARTRFLQFYKAHAEYFDTHYWDFMAVTLGVAGVKSSPLRHEAIGLRDKYESILLMIVKRGIETGEFRDMGAEMMTRAALSLLNWLPRWYRPNGPMSASSIAVLFAEMFVDGIVPRNR